MDHSTLLLQDIYCFVACFGIRFKVPVVVSTVLCDLATVSFSVYSYSSQCYLVSFLTHQTKLSGPLPISSTAWTFPVNSHSLAPSFPLILWSNATVQVKRKSQVILLLRDLLFPSYVNLDPIVAILLSSGLITN